MEKAAVSFKSPTEEMKQQMKDLMSPLWNDQICDLHSFLEEIHETEISGKDNEIWVEKFEINIQYLAKELDLQKRAKVLSIIQQLVYQNTENTEFDTEDLKAMVEILTFLSRLEDQDDLRHFYERFHQNVGIDPDKVNAVPLSREILKHLSELMIIIAMSNKMGEEDVEYIFSLVRREWKGNGKEVGPFLNDTFKEMEVRENIGQDLVARFKEVTEILVKLCNELQKKKVMDIIQGLIDADNKVSVQEKILYKIVKTIMD